MNCLSRIPDKVEKIFLTANEQYVIDTKGLGCIIKPSDCDIFVKAKAGEDNGNAFIVRKAESFEFCSHITVFASQDTSVFCMLYSTL